MSLFFPGRSRCRLCATPLGARVDATRLSFVHPQLAPAWTHLSRAFVHRRC